MRLRSPLAVLLTLALTATAFAQRRDLSVGDAAPGLNIEQWVKGPETTIENGRTYVVYFWATHCTECVKAMPVLTGLQDRYGDRLTIIGISTEESEVVERFVTSQGSNMNIVVAADRRRGTERAWMGAADVDDMPAVFIVDHRGQVQFIGSPLEERFTSVLPLVLSKRYDARLFEQAQPMIDAARGARKVRNWRMCFKMLDDIIKVDPTVFGLYTLEKLEIMLVDMNDATQASVYANEILERYADDAGVLAALAEMIVTSPKIPDDKRDLDLAMRAAEAAAKVSDRNDPTGYSVQALVHYHAGRMDKAISLQRKAYFIARPEDKPGFKRVLKSYQEAATRG
ncbi:MAG: TlpA family protein disulfide reductase [Phycisphaerales bacterium]|nr:TlpA family protein disulfide reductase [Phycisphaerae bacterium]NNF43072.1 TlpA family protein disulfide reductase [Phycisphaerales bacterium]NNM24538.1 TlpA family protein disulfide reductase [Phycisphaerales bacterium]